jgi:hypothetical protein
MPILVLLLAVALWVALGFGLARWSGWSSLALYYRGSVPNDGLRWHFISARVGSVGYRRCLTLGADSRGLRLSMWLPMRFSHRSLSIPWAEIDALGPCYGSTQPMVGLQLRRTPGVAIELPRQVAIAALRQAYGRTLPQGANALLAADARPGAAPPRPLESI